MAMEGVPEEGLSMKKAKYWTAVLWEENLIPDWESKVADTVQLPFAYAAHDMDTDSKSEHRKNHVHMIIAFPNTTTYSHALNVFKLLGAKAVNTCQACISIRKCYDYLIHDTDQCRKDGKYLYPPEHRICGNNFDIGFYEQLSEDEKVELFHVISEFIIEGGFADMHEFYVAFRQNFDGARELKLYMTYSAAFERLVKGNYQYQEKRKAVERAKFGGSGGSETHQKCCPECGSLEFKKKGKTKADQQRYKCKNCGKSFV